MESKTLFPDQRYRANLVFVTQRGGRPKLTGECAGSRQATQAGILWTGRFTAEIISDHSAIQCQLTLVDFGCKFTRTVDQTIVPTGATETDHGERRHLHAARFQVRNAPFLKHSVPYITKQR